MPEEVHIFEDASGGLRVWPPFVFVHKVGGNVRWHNHTANLVEMRDLPLNVILGVMMPHNIPAAGAGGVPGSIGPHGVDPAAARGTYKYHVFCPTTGKWARGSEFAVD